MTPAELAEMARPAKELPTYFRVTYVIKVGNAYVGKKGVSGLEQASRFYTVADAKGLLAGLRMIKSAVAKLEGAVIMAYGRDSMTEVA